MKKTISMILSAAIFFSLILPASAADPEKAGSSPGTTSKAYSSDDGKADARLAEVTLKVKETLGISNDYTNFYGNYTESKYGTRWQLNWSSSKENLNVQADDNGKVYSMSLNSTDYTGHAYDYKYYYRPNYNPIFPKVTKAQASVAAKAFLEKVLDKNESVEFNDYNESPTDTDTYSFSGYLSVNGLKTDISFSVNVRTSDLSVSYFYRDDSYYYITGDYPTTDTQITPEEALNKLNTIYTAKAQYALVDNSKVAKLVYYVTQNGNYIVNAKTGELVTVNDYRIYNKSYESPVANAGGTARDSAPAYLTETEQKGVKYLEGTLTADQLDAKVKSEPVFGLTSEYVMGGVSYYVSSPVQPPIPTPIYNEKMVSSSSNKPVTTGTDTNEMSGDVTATFTYTLKITDYAAFGITADEWTKLISDGNTPQVTKTFTLNAKTGEIESCYTNYNGFKWDQRKTSTPVISKTAEDYLAKRFSDRFPKSKLYNSSANGWSIETYSFTYCQSVSGYFYPGNSINVTINVHTGNIDSFSSYWDDTVTFAPAGTVISEDAAVKTYSNTFKADLQYSKLPVNTDTTDYSYPAAYNVLLAYTLINKNSGKSVNYIDAVTGEAVYYDWSSQNLLISYNDIDSCYAKDEISKLAEYGVGYYGTSFEPEKKLTELDMVLFLISANGYVYNYGDFNDDTLKAIYSAAYSLNILTDGQKDPGRAISRTDIVRSLVSMAGYSDVAKLKDIYRCGFTDDDQIKTEDYGYVAIAKGLGLVTGDPSGDFRPYDSITRQELAHMMYNYMSR